MAGSVEVWSAKGASSEAHECHQWDLNFKSVADIEVNSARENQFFIIMNSEDKVDGPLNSILLF